MEKMKKTDLLEALIKDDDEEVRCEVARLGYGLDRLIKDDSYEVRKEVAKQCKGWEYDHKENDELAALKKNYQALLKTMEDYKFAYYGMKNTLLSQQSSGKDSVLINDILDYLNTEFPKPSV